MIEVNLDNLTENSGPSNFMNFLKEELKNHNDNFSKDIVISSALIRIKDFNKLKVLRIDGIWHPKDIIETLRNQFIKFYLIYSNAIIFQSKFSKNLITNFLNYEPNKPFEIIPNGVPEIYFKTDLSIVRNKKKINLITYAHWRPKKRLKNIIDCFINMNDSSFLLYVGGSVSDELKKLYLNYKNIIFLGNLDQNQKIYFLNSSDIFLFPSYLDNCPNSVVEALAVGLPVVCSSASGVPELVKDHGYIIQEDYIDKNGKIKNFVSISQSEFNNSIDHCLKIKKKRHIDFHISNISKRYLNFIRKL